jgi:hypothetical protein
MQENNASREVILAQRNELLDAEAKAQARVDAETARLREERDEILAELRANHTAYIRAALTRNAAHDQQIDALNRALNASQEAATRAQANLTAELTAQTTAARREAEALSRCVVSLFFALEASQEVPPASPVERLLTKKQRAVPITPVASELVARIRSGSQSLWYFSRTDAALTFEADLKPGRYLLRLKAMASEPIGLQVSAGAGQPRAVGQLDRHVASLTIPFDVTRTSRELHLSLPRPIPLALAGGFTLFREIDESPSRIIRRRLLNGARHLPMARRLARSRVGQALRSAPAPATAPAPAAQPTDALTYAPWMEDRIRERQSLYQIAPRPGLFSLLTSAWNTPVEYLDVLAKSVIGQWDYPTFEWIVLDNGSTNPDTIAYIQGLARHSQVKIFRVDVNLGIVGGMRYCLERATGRYVLPLDSDDYLYPDCLRIMAWHINQYGYPPLLYSDEDKLQGNQFRDEYLKPSWDPVLFLNSCYIAHFDAIDRELALELGAYSDPGAEGCHDWDTFIRFMLAKHRPTHVPEVVYSWRMHPESAAQDIMSKSYIYSSHEHVLGKYLAAQPHPERYRVELSPLFNGYPEWWFRRTHTDPRPLLSLILSRDPAQVNTQALLDATDYPDHRVQAISISGGREEITRLAAEQHEIGGLIHLQYEDVQVEGNEWPWEALAIMELRPETMMVGGRIVDGAGQIVAAGEYFGYGGASGCPDLGRPLGHPGYFGQMWKQRSVSAVSTMFAVIDAHFLIEFLRQDGYEQLSLPFLGAWAGIYARWAGKRVVYSPFLLGHLPGGRAAWDELILPAEQEAFIRMNGDLIPDTRFLSPLISLDPAMPPYTAVSAAQRLATAPSGLVVPARA